MDLKKISNLLAEIRSRKPLVHHITNYVTVNDCANIVLAIGGSPVMADDRNEVEEMVALASALVINIGTLNADTCAAMLLAGKKANALGLPVIFDPVGAGATRLRTQTAQDILQQVKIAVIRGNLSEIKVLAGLSAVTRGVDATDDDIDAGRTVSRRLAEQHRCTVAVTGAVDVISDADRTVYVENGHPFLTGITGTGCMATSLIGVYSAVTADPLLAAAAGLVTMGLAGERAYQALGEKDGIGMFRLRLFDCIRQFNPEDLWQGARLRYE